MYEKAGYNKSHYKTIKQKFIENVKKCNFAFFMYKLDFVRVIVNIINRWKEYKKFN